MPSSLPARSLDLPRAARLQVELVALDLRLQAVARERHPTARWWWGVRERDHGRGAWCYLCERMVQTWDTRYPLTGAARAAIVAHRDAEHGPAGP